MEINKNQYPIYAFTNDAWAETEKSGKHDQYEEATAMEAEQNGAKSENPATDETILQHNCWWKFKKAMRSLWATKYTEETSGNRELYIKTTLRELLVYMVFLIIIMIVAFGMIDQTTFYYTKALKTMFFQEKIDDSDKSFETVWTINDVWKYLLGPLMNGLYSNFLNQERNPSGQGSSIYYENKLLGIPRIRQLRVRNNSCTVQKVFQTNIKYCYGEFNEQNEDTNSFGLNIPTAWVFTSKENMNSSGVHSFFNNYHSGGFYQDLSKNKSESIAILGQLFQYLWITLETRVVFIDFTFYNPNINLFSVIKIIFEFPASGGVLPSYDFKVVKLLRYTTSLDFFICSCEIIFVLFICYYIVEEILEIKKHKLSYFSDFWNILDVIMIIISLLCISFNIYRTANVNNMIQDLLSNENQFPQFGFLSYCQHVFNNAVAINLFIAWIKIFKYISFNKTMTQLSSTLSRGSKDLAGFALMFFIVFFAFAELGFFVFGSQIEDFKDLYQAA